MADIITADPDQEPLRRVSSCFMPETPYLAWSGTWNISSSEIFCRTNQIDLEWPQARVHMMMMFSSWQLYRHHENSFTIPIHQLQLPHERDNLPFFCCTNTEKRITFWALCHFFSLWKVSKKSSVGTITPRRLPTLEWATEQLCCKVNLKMPKY